MKDTIVYLVIEVVEHEGSSVIGVYSNGKDADARADQERANNRIEGYRFAVVPHKVL